MLINKFSKFSTIAPEKGAITPNADFMIGRLGYAYELQSDMVSSETPIMVLEAQNILHRIPLDELRRIKHYKFNENEIERFEFDFVFVELLVDFVERKQSEMTESEFAELGFPKNIRECRKHLRDVVTATVESIASILWFSMTPEQRLVRVLRSFPVYKGFDFNVLDEGFQLALTDFALRGKTIESLPQNAVISGIGEIASMSEFEHIVSVNPLRGDLPSSLSALEDNPIYGDFPHSMRHLGENLSRRPLLWELIDELPYLGTINELKQLGCDVPKLSLVLVNQASPEQLAELEWVKQSVCKIFV